MKRNVLTFILGALALFIVLTAIRFIAYEEPAHTHYHANFAVFIDGNKIDFNKPQYMEEVSSCDVTTHILPKQRVHLHNSIGDSIHVHQEGSTWNHLFNNIGWNLGDTFIQNDKNLIYETNSDKKLTFILNGKKVDSVFNLLIKSEDRLLINYGTESIETLTNDRFSQVSSSAKEYNTKKDPATCAGEQEHSVWDRLKDSIL
jgi:hypothetical protein